MLSDLRAGWCSSVGNEDIMPLTSLAALTLLELSRTQVWQAFITSPCLHRVLVQAVPICMPYAVLHNRSMSFEQWSNDALLHHCCRAPDASQAWGKTKGTGTHTVCKEHKMRWRSMVAWQVGDAGLEAVGTMAGLRVLGLAGCLRVTDAGLIPLLRLVALEELSLAACKLTSAGDWQYSVPVHEPDV